MSTIVTPSTASLEADAGALAERILAASNATMELATINLGLRLGLYQGLEDDGPATAPELAERTGTDARYVREWLEQQAVAGLLTCPDPGVAPDERHFALPAGHAEALLAPESPAAVGGIVRITVGVLSPGPRLTEAFRTGEGVAYSEYGEDTREGIAEMNRPMFANELAQAWLPALPDVSARLSRAPAARVADIACGCGWSSLAIAKGYPLARVDGFDADPASIERARQNADAAGTQERVRFFLHDAAADSLSGSYDLVTIFEAVHDMARPVDALRAARGLLADGGCVLVADARVAERFTAPADETERLVYGFSVLHCLPVGREDEHSAATGTVMRVDTLRAYATEAGFGGVTVLPVENDFWRFYRLDP